MNSPRISLITPTRGRPDLLLRTIASVQRQTLTDWELIVVDDGDGSGMVAAQGLGDLRIRAFQNPGAGQVDARNAAVVQAQAEVIHLLDDDDRWADEAHLEQVLERLQAGPGLVYRGGWLVLEEVAGDGWTERERLSFGLPVTAESLRTDNTLLTSGVAYPRVFHDELGAFDVELGNYWDWDWFLRVAGRYPLLALHPPAVLMSWRTSNTSRDPHEPARVQFLNRLRGKHGLGELASKNHFTVLVSPV
ncbi:glycosyltransferase family 2 protein [Deinococcus sp. UYEF24]